MTKNDGQVVPLLDPAGDVAVLRQLPQKLISNKQYLIPWYNNVPFTTVEPIVTRYQCGKILEILPVDGFMKLQIEGPEVRCFHR